MTFLNLILILFMFPIFDSIFPVAIFHRVYWIITDCISDCKTVSLIVKSIFDCKPVSHIADQYIKLLTDT
jgi:hypothetical protein